MSKNQEKEKAMEYLREHNLEVVLNGFVNRVARERPEDPILTLEHSLSAEATKRRGIVAVEAEPYSINGFLFAVQVTLWTHMSTQVCISPIEPVSQFRETCSLLSYENAAKAAAIVNSKISEAILGIDPQEQERLDKSIGDICTRYAAEIGHFNIGIATSLAVLRCGRDVAANSMTNYLLDKFMLKVPQSSFSTLLLPMISPSFSSEGPVMLSRAVGLELDIQNCTNLPSTLASLCQCLKEELHARNMLTLDMDSFGTVAPPIPVNEHFGVEQADTPSTKKKGGKKGKGDAGDSAPPLAVTENGLKCIHTIVEKLGVGQSFALCGAADLLISKEKLQEEEEQGAGTKDKKKGGGKGKGASAADFADDAILYDFNARVNFPEDSPPQRDIHRAGDIVDGYSRMTHEVSSFSSVIDPLSADDSDAWKSLVSPPESGDETASPRRPIKSFIVCTPQHSHADAVERTPMLSFGHFSTISSLVEAVQTESKTFPKLGICALSIAPLNECIADIACALGIEVALLPGLLREDVFRLAKRFRELSVTNNHNSTLPAQSLDEDTGVEQEEKEAQPESKEESQ
eukprot:gb/GECG01009886.1/.p1 GENE.gb/GECG01009886.1/~~gb/GECG01009886.1/.p1  ORF type:complete len:574 (+),score=87.11 gb/GECG01009886.1/:1-1722(+)